MNQNSVDAPDRIEEKDDSYSDVNDATAKNLNANAENSRNDYIDEKEEIRAQSRSQVLTTEERIGNTDRDKNEGKS